MRATFKFIALSCVLLSFGLSDTHQGRAEISYNNLRLETWLDNYWYSQSQNDAIVAIQSIGTNALPTLVSYVGNTGSNRNKAHRRALAGFSALGEQAAGAIPALEQSLNDPLSARCAAVSLGAIGTNALSILTLALSSKHEEARWGAVSGLGLLGTNASSALPELAKMLRDPSVEVRWNVAHTIKFVGSASDTIDLLGLMLLTETNEFVRSCAAKSLTWTRSFTTSAIPVMVEATNDQSYVVKTNTMNALKRVYLDSVPPEPLLFDGIIIEGPRSFHLIITNALSLLKNEAKDAFLIVTNHIRWIRPGEKSGVWLYEQPIRVELSESVTAMTRAWVASVIAHEAFHCKLFKDAHPPRFFFGTVESYNQIIRTNRSIGLESRQAAELRCLKFQAQVLEQVGGTIREIEYCRNEPGNHWDLNNDGKRDWADWKLQDW